MHIKHVVTLSSDEVKEILHDATLEHNARSVVLYTDGTAHVTVAKFTWNEVCEVVNE